MTVSYKASSSRHLDGNTYCPRAKLHTYIDFDLNLNLHGPEIPCNPGGCVYVCTECVITIKYMPSFRQVYPIPYGIYLADMP